MDLSGRILTTSHPEKEGEQHLNGYENQSQEIEEEILSGKLELKFDAEKTHFTSEVISQKSVVEPHEKNPKLPGNDFVSESRSTNQFCSQDARSEIFREPTPALSILDREQTPNWKKLDESNSSEDEHIRRTPTEEGKNSEIALFF